MSIFEKMFHKKESKTPDMGRAASALSLLAGADAGDGEGPLVMPNIYRDRPEGSAASAERLRALQAAGDKAGVVWDQTTVSMQKVDAKGAPVEKQDN